MPGSPPSNWRRPSRTIRLSSPRASRTGMVRSLLAPRQRTTGRQRCADTTSRHRRTGWRRRHADSRMPGRQQAKEAGVSADQLDEMGPIDYVVLEWPGEQPVGDAVPLLLDLVDRGIIRILDIAFMAKDEDGTVAAIDLAGLNGGKDGFAVFEGASTGLIGDEDVEAAAEALAPGTSAALLVWENRWAAPVAVAVRRSGGQLVASGRIPIQAILASLDAVEATH